MKCWGAVCVEFFFVARGKYDGWSCPEIGFRVQQWTSNKMEQLFHFEHEVHCQLYVRDCLSLIISHNFSIIFLKLVNLSNICV